MKRTGPTNPNLKELIENLKKLSAKEDVNIWRKIATDLEKPTRNKHVVNLSKIARFSKDGETMIIPGKVLSAGELTQKVNVAAFQFSASAIEKIKQSNGTHFTIEEIMKKNPKGEKLRIII